jgi:hypothetical protein
MSTPSLDELLNATDRLNHEINELLALRETVADVERFYQMNGASFRLGRYPEVMKGPTSFQRLRWQVRLLSIRDR